MSASTAKPEQAEEPLEAAPKGGRDRDRGGGGYSTLPPSKYLVMVTQATCCCAVGAACCRW